MAWMNEWMKLALTVQVKYLQSLKCRPVKGTEGGQAGLVQEKVSSLGPKVSSCCCSSPCKAATKQFVPSKSKAAHEQPRNGAELQDSFPVSFSGQCRVTARIYCVIARIVYNAHFQGFCLHTVLNKR